MHAQLADIPPDKLVQVQDSYDRGLFLQAYDFAKTLGPLSAWQGAEATVLASRLAAQLGSSTLPRWLIRRAWRQYPNNGLVRCYYAYHLMGSRGPYSAWRWMHEMGELSGEEPEAIRADWCALLGSLAANLRDFDTAEAWLERASALASREPWIEICRSTMLELEDRYEEALACARRSLEPRPWYCPAVECTAHLLTLMDRDVEAVELLTEATEHVESMRLVYQLCGLRVELRQYETAEALLDRCAALAPLAERPLCRWMASRRSDVAYHLGKIQDAARHAKEAGPGFYESVAARLESSSHGVEPRSVLLPVGFVRQHHVTCAPATLSAISRFWSKPADHLEVAEEICYSGTTAFNERKWARTHGWVAREFTVTEASASALLNRGIPFTFTTVDPGGGHLQAIIGYDQRRGTFWVRDPFWRNTGEAIVDTLLQRYRAHGPRGMAIVPVAERTRFEELDLPDASRWDRLHELDAALVEHRREDAQAICEQLIAEANGHRLGHEARHRLAGYDANPAARLTAVEKLLEFAPEDPCLQLDRLACLRDLVRRDERMSIYGQLCEKRDVHPVFLQQYAQELRADARRHGEAVSLLLRAIRRAPCDAGNYCGLANVFWDQRRFAEAFELYRFATCMNDKDESFADSFFRAARWFKQTDDALAFLQRRFRRFGRQSSLPARTLVQAYLQCDRTTEALEALEEAMRLRPNDGELRLFAADTYLACNRENAPRALALLEENKGVMPQALWLRTVARLAYQDGRPKDALSLWQEASTLQPLAIDAHQAIANLLMETQGKPAVLAHLAGAADRFPHYQPLYQLRLQWVQDEPPDARESVIRQAVAQNPHDAWLHRELALFLIEQHRQAEAWAEIEVAGQLEPKVPIYHLVRAQLLRDEGKTEEAKSSLREAIRLSIDYRFAIDAFIALCTSADERRDALAFIKEELVRQVTFGDGLLAFRDQSHGTLSPEELLKVLRQALEERPDLWHAWSACIQQLLTLSRLDEAWELVQQATDRFPLLPAIWLDRAAACKAREDWEGEREALHAAYQINPDWGEAVRYLADLCEREGDFEQARQILDRAVVRRPLDANNQIMLAETLWRQGNREAALERICHVIDMEPGYDHAWGNLRTWGAELGRQQIAVDVARKLTERRGSEAQSWFLLAGSLDSPAQIDERIAALDKAVAMNPRFIQAHDLRAIAMVGAQRWDEARRACCPPAWDDNPPMELKGRAIWIMSQQGNIHEAIPKMRALLTSEPGYHTGWCWLWEWCRSVEDYAGCMAAGKALVRLNPQYEVGLGYLAEAHRLRGDSRQAAELFRRAYDLNPRYEFAGLSLFDLQIQGNFVDYAAETLAVLQRYSTNPFVQARAVQLEAVFAGTGEKKDAIAWAARVANMLLGRNVAEEQPHREAAVRYLREVCTSTCNSPWPVAFAIERMIAAGWRRTVLESLSELLYVDGAHEEVARQWVRLHVAGGYWNCGRRLRALAEQRGNIGIEAAATYIDMLIHNKRKARFRRFLWWNKDWLHSHGRTWGKTAYAMVCFGWPARRFVRWTKDWRRKDVEFWMFANIVEVLRTLKRDADAAEISRYALTLPMTDRREVHTVWLAADAACNGECAVARRLLAELPQPSPTPAVAFVKRLATAVVEMASAEPADKPSAFHAARRNLREAVAHYRLLNQDPARKRLYRQCIRSIALHEGSWKGQIWHCVRWFLSW